MVLLWDLFATYGVTIDIYLKYLVFKSFPGIVVNELGVISFCQFSSHHRKMQWRVWLSRTIGRKLPAKQQVLFSDVLVFHYEMDTNTTSKSPGFVCGLTQPNVGCLSIDT